MTESSSTSSVLGVKSSGVVVSQRRTIDPYDLTPSDNSRCIISQVVLKGDNYDEWADEITMALRARKKFGFVDGSIPEPGKDSSDLEDWWTNNSLIISWIRNTIGMEVRRTISRTRIAKDLWTDVKERFSVPNGARYQHVMAEVMTCKQRGLSIADYYGKLKKFWEDLDHIDPLPRCECSGCTCGGCTCDLIKVIEKRSENQKVHQFLFGLDEDMYGSLRTTLLAQDPIPNINRVYNSLIQEESVKNKSRLSDGKAEVMSFAVQTGQKKGWRDEKDKNAVCTHCGRTGHEVDRCFQKHGYPEWYFEQYATGRGAGRGLDAGRGNGRGRGRTNGPGRGFGRANVVQATPLGDNQTLNGATQESVQTLINLLNASKIDGTERLDGKKTWILNTGASSHMTGNLENLNNVQSSIPCSVGLPDGRETVSVKQGNAYLSDKFKVHNVLYVPVLPTTCCLFHN